MTMKKTYLTWKVISAVYALLRDSHDSISNDAGDIINEIEDTENIDNENDMDSDGDED